MMSDKQVKIDGDVIDQIVDEHREYVAPDAEITDEDIEYLVNTKLMEMYDDSSFDIDVLEAGSPK